MDDSEQWHQLMLDQEQAAIDALTRCEIAGADPEDLETLAALIGVSSQWKHHDATDKTR